jgi:hypothetical protein
MELRSDINKRKTLEIQLLLDCYLSSVRQMCPLRFTKGELQTLEGESRPLGFARCKPSCVPRNDAHISEHLWSAAHLSSVTCVLSV